METPTPQSPGNATGPATRFDLATMGGILRWMGKLVQEHGEEKAMKVLDCVLGISKVLGQFDKEIGALTLMVLIDIINSTKKSVSIEAPDEQPSTEPVSANAAGGE